MSITFAVLVDTANDTTYATDLSAYVLTMDWQMGFSTAYDPIARDSTATITLDNRSQKFSPESASAISGLTKGRRLMITSFDGSTTRTHYVGWVDRIVPTVGFFGIDTAAITCISFFQRAQNAESYVPIQQSVTADVVIAAILNNAAVYPPGIPKRWQLGISGYSELGNATYLGSTTDYLIAETGVSTFNYIGDQWANGVSVMGAIRDTCGREYGRVFLDRNGLLNFWNRQHLILNSTVAATFDNTMYALNYSWGDEIINSVKVKARPRKVGSAPEVLGRLDKASQVIQPGASLNLAFNYADLANSGAKIGGKNIISPVQTTDFLANSAADGSGTNYTTSVTATMSETATRASVTFANAAAVPVYILAGAQVRGTAIRDFGEMEYVSDNLTSQAAYYYSQYVYPYEADNLSDAQAIADYISTSRAAPIGMSNQMTLQVMVNATMQTHGLTRTMGDRVTLKEAQTGMNTDYFIMGEHHTVNNHVNDWQVSYFLEPAGSYRYWLLGVAGFSELEQTTFVGPL